MSALKIFKILSLLNFLCLISAPRAFAISGSYDPNLKMEAQAPCADGSCYGFDKDGGLSQFRAKVINANVFNKQGLDPRVPQDQTGEENKALAPIGLIVPDKPVRLSSGKIDRSAGTAFMISPCFMFTNYHAVFGHTTDPDLTMTVSFYPGGYDSNQTKAYKGTIYAHGNFQTDRKKYNPQDDFAIVRLDDKQCVGRDIGYIEPAMLNEDEFAKTELQAYGYPKDNKQLYKDPSCHLIGVDSGKAYAHDCAQTGGDSGGPIMQFSDDGVPRVVAMMTSSYTPTEKILKSWDKQHTNAAVDTGLLFVQFADVIQDDIAKHGRKVNPAMVRTKVAKRSI